MTQMNGENWGLQDIIPMAPWERSLRATKIKLGPLRISKIRWESIPEMR